MKKLPKNFEDSSIYKVVPSDEGIFMWIAMGSAT
jgi:hypothetical protein